MALLSHPDPDPAREASTDPFPVFDQSHLNCKDAFMVFEWVLAFPLGETWQFLSTGILWVESRNSVRYPTIYKVALTKIALPKMSGMLN